MYKCKHFGIKELVSPIVYKRFGDFAWSFFGEDVLKDLDVIRQEWGGGIVINDWAWGGQYKESGLRCNRDSLVVGKKLPYLSGHVLAKAFDLKPVNKKYKEFRAFLWGLLNTGRLKAFKRLETFSATPTWVHADCLRTVSGKPEIFNV